MPDRAQRIADNLTAVRQRMAEAARRSGRDAADITLVAVTKYVGPEDVGALIQAGCRELGESRPQELWRKAEALADTGARWHLVGHLQRNKVRRTLPYVALIHSGDSLRLLDEIDRAAAAILARGPLLLEANVSGDRTKHGFQPDEIEPLLPRVAALEHIQVRGLMAMAGLESDADTARREFARLRQLRETLQRSAPAAIQLAELSMGMSRDFEAAIEEGATIVRVGTALFEGLAT